MRDVVCRERAISFLVSLEAVTAEDSGTVRVHDPGRDTQLVVVTGVRVILYRQPLRDWERAACYAADVESRLQQVPDVNRVVHVPQRVALIRADAKATGKDGSYFSSEPGQMSVKSVTAPSSLQKEVGYNDVAGRPPYRRRHP